MLHILEELMPSVMDSPYEYVPPAYRKILNHLLAGSPAAKANFENGNVLTALRLLKSDSSVRIRTDVGVTKDAFLTRLLNVMPTVFQFDLNPDMQ